MAAAYDLVSLAQAQQWAGNAANNVLLTGSLITSVSRLILTALSRPSILPANYLETLDGTGQPRLMLRNWPVTAISSLVVDRAAVPAAPSPTLIGTPSGPDCGYLLSPWDGNPPGSPQWLDLTGYRPCRGRQNIAVQYTAGYQITAEARTVPASTPFQLAAGAPLGAWASDVGVTYATGVALTKVASGPAVGQYSVAAGEYTFAAADEGAAVLISYGFIPADLANAAAQWLAEWLAYQSRIGVRSKTLGGQESISYIVGPIPPMVQQMIGPYRRVTF